MLTVVAMLSSTFETSSSATATTAAAVVVAGDDDVLDDVRIGDALTKSSRSERKLMSLSMLDVVHCDTADVSAATVLITGFQSPRAATSCWSFPCCSCSMLLRKSST